MGVGGAQPGDVIGHARGERCGSCRGRGGYAWQASGGGRSGLGGGGGGDVACGVHVGDERLGAAADGSVALEGREEGRRSGGRGRVVVQGDPPAGAGAQQGDCVLVPVHRGIVCTQPGGSEDEIIAREIEDMEVCAAGVGIGVGA